MLKSSFSILALFIISLGLISCTSQTIENSMPVNNASDAYEFPIRPGMDAWSTFTTHTEMVEACQIPEAVLENISTAGLVETVLNYPLTIDIWAFGSSQIGVEAVTSQFNGIPELFNRSDAATELLAKYQRIDVLSVSSNWEPADRAKYTLGTVAFSEIMLVQDSIVSKMTDTEMIDLITEALNKSNEKSELSGIYGPADQIYTIRIIAVALQQQNYAPFIQMIEESEALQQFIDYASFISTDLLDDIVSIAREFLMQT